MSNSQALLVCIPYNSKDITQARSLLAWIGKISPNLGPHCCLMAADAAVPHEVKLELGNAAKAIFYYAETAVISTPTEATAWPKAANAMFRIASTHIKACFKLPFLWMEPDCVPMRPSWLDEIAVSYARSPKRFMGSLIPSSQPPMPPLHLAGCAVYPPDAADELKPFTEGDSAWDIASAPFVVPRTYPTPLIHHHWGEPGLPPTFVAEKIHGGPINACTLDFVRPEAAIFHRCKDSTLIDLLSKQRDSATKPAAEPKATSEAPKRAPGRPKKPEPVAA